MRRWFSRPPRSKLRASSVLLVFLGGVVSLLCAVSVWTPLVCPVSISKVYHLLMASNCGVGQYWDTLIKKCFQCHMECHRLHVIPRCASFCESTNCKARPGHYFDGLLKKCIRCTEVCGRHPAECSQDCQILQPPVTTKRLLVTSHVSYSRAATGLEDATLLLYPLLSLCMVLLFSSLCLALVVFLRGARAKNSKLQAKEANCSCKECVVQHGQEVGQSVYQLGQSSKDFATNSSHPTDCEPSEDSSPTETCAVVPRAHVQKGEALWTQGNAHPVREGCRSQGTGQICPQLTLEDSVGHSVLDFQ
uniref:tumor necrosis factor receptor superfamily member 13B isoform X2 n=1 Tax=Scatophagus argus TaxID=75038 RepID=UPI001ED7FF64|nr:tumor necrosis factor receptor superfamily member 13B isoform X2 [Scatophagus argus]